ncbi:MAG TPA: hypothetical protein VH350_20165 [Candidatus Sulfotelmatobacter sp.]|nr:hypothetical protein [Candidatus Sulfotelmatobacter sp.]
MPALILGLDGQSYLKINLVYALTASVRVDCDEALLRGGIFCSRKLRNRR